MKQNIIKKDFNKVVFDFVPRLYHDNFDLSSSQNNQRAHKYQSVLLCNMPLGYSQYDLVGENYTLRSGLIR